MDTSSKNGHGSGESAAVPETGGVLLRPSGKKGFRKRKKGIAGVLGFRQKSGTVAREESSSQSVRPSFKGGSKKASGDVEGRTALGRYLDWAKVGVLLVLGVLSLLVAFDGWSNAEDVYGGVGVGGVGVGGKSPDSASQMLSENTANLPDEVTFVSESSGGDDITLSRQELGIRVDAGESTRRAYSVGREGDIAERTGERLQSVFRVAEVRPEISYDRAAIKRAFEKDPVNAGYRETNLPTNEVVRVRAGSTGLAIDESFWEGLDTKLMQGEGRIEVPLKVVEPDLTTAEAEALKPTDLLSTYQTNYLTYDDTPGRTANLQISSGAVNGTMLAPGEVFSFNELAEPLDYEAAKVIVQGKADEADGGGLCQVSSTLYVAANLAGLEIVERHPHMAELPYIQPGLDATVWFGALDMKFRNSSPGYVYIQQWVDTTTGNVHAAIYGQPTGISATMDSVRTANYKDSEKNRITEWVTYKTVTQNGEVLFDGPLHTDVYKELEEDEGDV